jgi:hypothetical protein
MNGDKSVVIKRRKFLAMLFLIAILGGLLIMWDNTPVPKHCSTSSAWKIKFLRLICCG